MDKKYYNYLYSLIIFNNINAGCKNYKDKDKDKTEQKKNINNQLNEEDTKKPVEDPNKEKDKDPKETEEEKNKRLEEEKLNKKADEIIEFLKILDTASKNSIHDKSTIINGTINKEELKSCIKYFQDLDFNTISTDAYTDENFYEDIYIKLFKIIDIDGQKKESILNDFSTNVKNDRKDSGANIYSLFVNILFRKYFDQLFKFDTTKCNLVIVKDKRNKDIHFVLEDNDQVYNDINENFEKLRICFGETPNIQKIKQSSNPCSDIEMNLALNLSKTLFITLIKSIGLSKNIIKHLKDSKNNLPDPKYASSIILYHYKQKNPNYYFRYSNDYNYLYTKEGIDANKLYSFESLIKIETTDDFHLKFTKEIGKIKSNLGYYFKDAPFSFETFEKIYTTLEKLKDINKITEVQNDLLKLLKEDKIYSGQCIAKLDYIPCSFVDFKEFKKEDIKNTELPYKYNIYIYNDNNEIKVDIKKWEDNEENKKTIGLINSFENDLKTLFGEQNYKFFYIVNLIKNIKDKFIKNYGDLINYIRFSFSQILTEAEWDKLDRDNLCIKIANDLSSIKLDKNPIKEANFKVLKLVKGGHPSYFHTEEVNK